VDGRFGRSGCPRRGCAMRFKVLRRSAAGVGTLGVIAVVTVLLVGVGTPSSAAARGSHSRPHAASTTRSGSAIRNTGSSVNAANYTIGCSTVTGKITFSQVLRARATGTNTTTFKFSVSLKGCTAKPSAGGTPITSITGSLSGGLTATQIHSNGCENVLLPGDPLTLS